MMIIIMWFYDDECDGGLDDDDFDVDFVDVDDNYYDIYFDDEYDGGLDDDDFDDDFGWCWW